MSICGIKTRFFGGNRFRPGSGRRVPRRKVGQPGTQSKHKTTDRRASSDRLGLNRPTSWTTWTTEDPVQTQERPELDPDKHGEVSMVSMELPLCTASAVSLVSTVSTCLQTGSIPGQNSHYRVFISPGSGRTCPQGESALLTPSVKHNYAVTVLLLLRLFPVFPLRILQNKSLQILLQ